MSDHVTLVVSCSNPERIMGATNALMPHLPVEIRDQLDWIKLRYWQLYGFDGLFERTNNRSVAAILAEYDSLADPLPIASGQVDGVSYKLFAAPVREPESRNQGGDCGNS
jgi:hypothetical protein